MSPDRIRAFLRSNIVFLLLLIAVWFGIRAWQQQDMHTGPLPVTTLTALDGTTLTLDALPRPFLIHFTASWCPVCQTQHGTLRALHQDWTVIQIITQSGDDAAARRYAQDNGIPLNRAVNDPDGRLLAQFGARGVPADFFVGQDGRIQMTEMGYTTGIGYRLRLWWLAR